MCTSIKPIVRQFYVAKNTNIIEINGKRYDAKTGEVLSRVSAAGLKPKTAVKQHTPAPAKKSIHDVVRQPAKHVAGHAPKTSRTLMRQSVKRPAGSLKRHVKAQGPADAPIAKPMGDILAKSSAQRLDPKRLQHASKVAKSSLISHFSDLTSEDFQPLQPSAQEAIKPLTSSSPAATKHGKPKTTAELLERAIQQASSHQQTLPAKPARSRAKRRPGLVGAAVISVLIIGAIGYHEVPNLRLHAASAKAGFSASLPGYLPAGYSMGPLHYSEGVVATKFLSNSDNRAYTITQKQSSWDSQALRYAFVKPIDPNYQTVESGGRTIYLYGENNATWVNGGVWYQVQSNGSLSDQQLVELAKSL